MNVLARAARLRTLSGAPILLLFGLLFVYPLLRFLALPLFPSLGPLGAVGVAAQQSSLSAQAILNTLQLALITAAVSVPAGILFAFLLECRTWSGNRVLTATLWLIFVLPSYLIATGFQILLGAFPRGSLIQHLFFSAPGIVLLLALKGLPFCVLAARTGWRAIGGEIGDAARIHIHDAWRRRMLLLRLLLPTAGAGFVIVFVEVLQDFGIAATLGAQIHLPLIIYAIYKQLTSMPIDFTAAARLSWWLVLLAGLAVALHLMILLRYTSASIHGRQREVARPACHGAEALAATLGLAALVVLGLAVPVLTLLAEAALPLKGAFLPHGVLTSLGNSAAYAGIAATLAVGLAAGLTARAGRSGRLRHALDVITLGNMAVPGLVLGAAYVIAFNNEWAPLYGTPLLLVVGYVATHTPMLVRFLQPALGQLHINLADAGRVHGLGFPRRLRRIHIPLLTKPLLWGWCLAFSQILFELPVSELLYPAGRTPLGVQLLGLDQNLNYVTEARLAICGILVCLAAIGVAAWLAADDSGPAPQERP
ncbi:MAG TPA: ABC transporter permease subunit [Acidocella sp.]|uniref:ABC transporter permease n=1 Tax=Acidocella sp. TaxID=50710 RepID=UPI002BF20A85|nr:ABC transporter permease subunit [Acidocella sp.]HVE20542.1 ABC transporter permease subunit [Acidocella sp.]